MSNQRLGMLAVVAAVMVLLAVISARTPASRRTRFAGPTHLIQGLDPTQIDSIVIGQDDETVTIQRQEGRFVVANAGNYPADVKQIDDLIFKALDIKVTELYTDNPKNHEDLEVTEDKARNVVKFLKADGSLLTGVVVGKSPETGQGAYVRLASSNDVYVAPETPWLRTRGLDYVNQEIVSVEREDLKVVTVTTPEGSYTLRAANDGGGAVLMDGLPADRKLDRNEARSVFTALQGLRFEEVGTPAQVEGLNFDHKYVALLENSTEYTFELAKKGDKTYLKARAAYTSPAKVTIKPGQVDSPEELKKKEAILLAQEHAQRFTLRHRDWVYEIPDWKARSLLKPQAELFEAVETPAAVEIEPVIPEIDAAPIVVPSLPVEEAPDTVPSLPTVAPQTVEPNDPMQKR
jgi:hypothetical protein